MIPQIFLSRTIFPRLVAGAEGDPALYIDIRDHNKAERAVLFDVGNIARLSPPEIAKLDAVFISHTHMDHFGGFDKLLRSMINEEGGKRITLYGPPGIIQCVRGRISGYVWNLIDAEAFGFDIFEIRGESLLHRSEEVLADEINERGLRLAPNELTHEALDGSLHALRVSASISTHASIVGNPKIIRLETAADSNGLVHEIFNSDGYRVQMTPLFHKIPSLSYAMIHEDYIHINASELLRLEIPDGMWIRTLKEKAQSGEGLGELLPSNVYEVSSKHSIKSYQDAMMRLLEFSPGERIAYSVDFLYSEDSESRLAKLASRADLYFCEGYFQDEHEDRATEKCHLTASQAGRIAKAANVKNLVLFHFSPLCMGRFSQNRDEARRHHPSVHIYS
ncbi:MAG: MBL fold metallo-hydrolase [Planctomycetes bacterium]|nr:MBL fold metallo-hydrolase [Planctomycetota bacterium]